VDKAIADKIRERYFPKRKPAAATARLVKAPKPVASPPAMQPDTAADVSKAVTEADKVTEKLASAVTAEPSALAGEASKPRIIKLSKPETAATPSPVAQAKVPATAPQSPSLAVAPTQSPASSIPKIIRLATQKRRPVTPPVSPITERGHDALVINQSTTVATTGEQKVFRLPSGAPQRTTYIPQRDTRPKGRHSKRPHGPVEKFQEGRQLERFAAPRLAQPILSQVQAIPAELKPVRLVEGTTVREFAEKLEVKPKDVVALLFTRGVMATINQTLNADVAREAGQAFGYDVSFGTFEEMAIESEFEITPEAMEDTETRAPVVTVMGHVDHGKTSLLDAVRASRVAEGEAGGITQHIGAYSVEVPDPDDPAQKRRIVFLDTPGHEAFTMMRARGAQVTDVVVLVVAADDGVMPQTVEAIEHAKAANVPIIVAINKIDKPDAQPDRVKKELADHGLLWEGWGGEATMVEVSAKQKQNIEALLEMILLTADLLDLKATSKRLATGTVLEAKLDRGRGAVATVLIQNGTLKAGEPFIAGNYFGRVRALFDDRGRQLREAGPATPVEVIGLQGAPAAGDQFQVVADVAKAQQISAFRQAHARAATLTRTAARGLDQLHAQMEAGEVKELLLILKADVQGSVEVLKETLTKLSTDRVKVRIIRSGVGAITESDVLLASASQAATSRTATVIIGFNVRPEPRAGELAKQERVELRLHSIIYQVEEEIRNAMLGMLTPTIKETVMGKAEIRQVIHVPKVGSVAGCMVIGGSIKRTAKARLIREGVVIFNSAIASLRRFKDDVSEVQQGYECGLTIERFNDYKVGDVIEAFVNEKVTPTRL
jgi:translation initiation factor IF-2